MLNIWVMFNIWVDGKHYSWWIIPMLNGWKWLKVLWSQEVHIPLHHLPEGHSMDITADSEVLFHFCLRHSLYVSFRYRRTRHSAANVWDVWDCPWSMLFLVQSRTTVPISQILKSDKNHTGLYLLNGLLVQVVNWCQPLFPLATLILARDRAHSLRFQKRRTQCAFSSFHIYSTAQKHQQQVTISSLTLRSAHPGHGRKLRLSPLIFGRRLDMAVARWIMWCCWVAEDVAVACRFGLLLCQSFDVAD